MSKQEIIVAYLSSSEKDVQTAQDLYNLGRYDWCLFLWHLVIEKALKACLLSEEKEVVYVHNLLRLAKQTNIPLDNQLSDKLREISTYNIEARYDDIKHSFYKKANKEYTSKWVMHSQNIYKSILKHIHEQD